MKCVLLLTNTLAQAVHISVFLITKYNIDSVLSLAISYHDIPSCQDIYHYIDMQQH